MSDQDFVRSAKFMNCNKISMLKKLRHAEGIATFHMCQLSCHSNLLGDPRVCLAQCDYYLNDYMSKRKALKSMFTHPLLYLASQPSESRSAYRLDE